MSDEGFNEEIHVPTRTGDLVSAGNYLTIGDKQFTLDTVDHISYWWTNRRTNGVYTGHFFSIKVKTGDSKGHWGFSTGVKEKDLDIARDGYARVVDRIEAVTSPRLANSMVERIRSGEKISMPGIVFDMTGVKARGPFSKVARWEEIAGTMFEFEYIRVLVNREGKKDKKKLLLHPDTWDVVLVPRVVWALAPNHD